MYTIIAILLIILWGTISIVTVIITHRKQFGSLPFGENSFLVHSSAHWKNHAFQNIHSTPNFTNGGNVVTLLYQVLFKKSKTNRPSKILPSKKVDLRSLNKDDTLLVWFGHSSYFLQIEGKKILVDPVFSGHASPFKFAVKSFNGSDVYTADDMPDIDYLLITHDHFDHLDYETVLKLQNKVSKIIVPYGVGAHFNRWNFDMNKVVESDWGKLVSLDDFVTLSLVPGRHFSGRGLKRNQSLWTAFVLKTPTMKIFIGGDSGYDTHFKDIGEAFGPFDLAILECGQYNKYWQGIHMMPEETVQAALDLKSKKILPVHWAKFSLALHSWDEPIIRLTTEAQKYSLPVVHPYIGEAVNLKKDSIFTEWWKDAIK
jgi:L-ascorbate metabolism protein UlaG (beta-lactamase superfamily)